MKTIQIDSQTVNVDGVIYKRESLKANRFLYEKPKEDDNYWHVNCSGIYTYSWGGYDADKGRWEKGDCFETKAQAQFECDRRIFIAKLKRWIHENNDGWVPNWKPNNNSNHFVYLDMRKHYLRTGDTFYSPEQPNWLYVKSEKIAKGMIEEFGEDLKKHYFEIQ